MTRTQYPSRSRIPCEDLRTLSSTVAEITTNIRLLSESQARTDKAISRLTEAMGTMAQHDGRLNHLEAEAARFHTHAERLWDEIKSLREATNRALSMAEASMERSRDHGLTLRQIIPWATAIISTATAIGMFLMEFK